MCRRLQTINMVDEGRWRRKVQIDCTGRKNIFKKLKMGTFTAAFYFTT